MSRRGGGNKNNGGNGSSGSTSVPVVGSLSLESSEETAPLSIASSSSPNNNGNDASSDSLVAGGRHNPSRVKQWKESAFATALTEPTWEAERIRNGFWSSESSRRMKRSSTRQSRNNNNDNTNDAANDNNNDNDDDDSSNNLHPDTTGCLCCSAMICPLLGAGRVGNMAVLSSTTEWVEEVEEDLETGETTIRRFTRPKLRLVVGPYWPMLVFVTYPLILVVSAWAFYASIWNTGTAGQHTTGHKPTVVIVAWLALTLGLILALGLTGCRDPGILYRHSSPPPQFENSWRWSDHAQSYRPRGAHFDTDTAVIVEEFDHTCPWTGTAIGKKNMLSFQFFVCLVFVCLIVDIFLITGAF